MNPITKALDELKFRIPKYILDQAFKPPVTQWRGCILSLDEMITNAVIRPRVLIDCNIVGGTEAFIYIEDVEMEMVTPYTAIYRIPKERTQGRTILSVSNVYNFLGGILTSPGMVTPFVTNDLMMAGNAMMNAMSSTPAISTAYVQLIAENTIMVKENTRLSAINYVRCFLADDENMNHLQLRSYNAFSRLVQLAVQSYIYNTLVINIDSAYLQGGQALGAFKEIVDKYADSEDMYQDYLINQWSAVAFMNDNETQRQFIKMMIGGMK